MAAAPPDHDFKNVPYDFNFFTIEMLIIFYSVNLPHVVLPSSSTTSIYCA